MGEVQFGTCDICKKQTIIESKFYHYGFKCDCHSPEHFERVNYCKDCVPKKPSYTKVTLTDEQAQFVAKAVEFYKNNGIKRGHWEEELVDHGCRYLCSECGYVSMQSYGCIAFGNKYNYCPNCGAKMDEERTQDET